MELSKFNEPIYVTRPLMPTLKEYIKEIESIWDTRWLTNNGELQVELQESLRRYLKVNNIELYTNGHLALDIAIKSLNLEGEVITTAFTFASTTHAITMNNLIPVFCDINEEDFNIDVNKIESLINDKTSAIIAVHVFGNPCNVYEIDRIAKKYNLKVIYDAAHATGVEVDGYGIGSFGDISMFSFHATKIYNTIEGGALTFNNDKFKERLRLYKNFGILDEENVVQVGLNAKMNEFQAAMGIVNLKYIEDEIAKRKVIWNIYTNNLKDINGITWYKPKDNINYNYSYFPIIIDMNKSKLNRNELQKKLKEYNVFTRKYFYPIVTEYECYKNRFKDSDLDICTNIANSILILPIYGGLNGEDVIKISKIIIGLLK